MTVDEVAGLIGKNRATVYRYESEGIRDMPVSVLENLAMVLRVAPGDLLAQGEMPPALSPVEERLVSMFRSLDGFGQDMVLTVAAKESGRCEEQRKL